MMMYYVEFRLCIVWRSKSRAREVPVRWGHGQREPWLAARDTGHLQQYLYEVEVEVLTALAQCFRDLEFGDLSDARI